MGSANGGQAPLTDGGSVSGSATSALTLNPVSSADSGSLFDVVLTNAWGYIQSSAATLTVNQSPAVTTTTLPNELSGASYNQTLAASGGTSPYTWAITGGSLPSGLSLVTSSGAITGTSTAVSTTTNNFTVAATDSSGTHCTSTNQALSIVVFVCPTITISGSLPPGTVDSAYSQTLSGNGGTSPYVFTLTSGSLPSGLTLSSGGVVSGTPLSSASKTFTITATDANGCFGTNSYTVQPACPTLTMTPSAGALSAGTLGVAYSTNFVASGANGVFTYSKTAG